MYLIVQSYIGNPWKVGEKQILHDISLNELANQGGRSIKCNINCVKQSKKDKQ